MARTHAVARVAALCTLAAVAAAEQPPPPPPPPPSCEVALWGAVAPHNCNFTGLIDITKMCKPGTCKAALDGMLRVCDNASQVDASALGFVEWVKQVQNTLCGVEDACASALGATMQLCPTNDRSKLCETEACKASVEASDAACASVPLNSQWKQSISEYVSMCTECSKQLVIAEATIPHECKHPKGPSDVLCREPCRQDACSLRDLCDGVTLADVEGRAAVDMIMWGTEYCGCENGLLSRAAPPGTLRVASALIASLVMLHPLQQAA